MRTIYSPDTTSLEELDFEIACQVKLGNNEHCPAVADWMAVLRCGHSFAYCDSHWHALLQERAVCWTCGVCPPPQPHWHSLGEAIVNSWRIKP